MGTSARDPSCAAIYGFRHPGSCLAHFPGWAAVNRSADRDGSRSAVPGPERLHNRSGGLGGARTLPWRLQYRYVAGPCPCVVYIRNGRGTIRLSVDLSLGFGDCDDHLLCIISCPPQGSDIAIARGIGSGGR